MQKLLKSASYLSVTVSLFILIVKLLVLFFTESTAVLASLIDSMLDFSSSIINFIAIRISFMPPDDNHRFGHEKIQDLAVFGQSVFFLGSGFFTLFFAVKKIFFYEGQILYSKSGVCLMAFSTVLTGCIYLYQYWIFKITKSNIIEVDKLHYLVDFLTNISVIISLYLSLKFWYIDSLLAIGIAIYIILSSYYIFRKVIKNLMDEEFSKEKKVEILNVILKYKEVLGVHELKTRMAGDKAFIQFHIEIDGNQTLLYAHEISDKIILDLQSLFQNTEVIVHQDPAGVETNVKYKEF